MSSLKVIAQNASKPLCFQFFTVWSVKYTHHIVTSLDYVWKVILGISNIFAKFHCLIKSITGVIKFQDVPTF